MRTPRISYRAWPHRSPVPVGEPSPAAAAGPVADPAKGPPELPVPAPTEVPAPRVAAGGDAVTAAEAAATETKAVEHLVFRLGRELFAVPLDLVEEAFDIDRIQRIPEMSPMMLGVLTLRGGTVPVYAPSTALGAPGNGNRSALLFVRPRGAVALAVDDVDDVLEIAAGTLQRAPLDFGDGILLGVVRRGSDLIGVLDADALIAACGAEPVLESA